MCASLHALVKKLGVGYGSGGEMDHGNGKCTTKTESQDKEEKHKLLLQVLDAGVQTS